MANANDPGKGNGEDGPITPYLFLPYDSADNGLRPLTGPVPWWMCQGIHINGAPYAGPLTPGDKVNLSLLIANTGALDAVLTANLYAAPPATAFTPTYLASYIVTSWI